jgi:MFS family permease
LVASEQRAGNVAFARVTIANGVFFIGVSLFLIFPRRLVELGANPRQVGLYMGLAGVAPLVLMPLVGAWADRYGTRRFLISGYLVSIACVLGYFKVTSIGPFLALLRIGGGAGFALLWVAGSVFAARIAPVGKLAHRVGLFGAATLVTHAIGPPLGEFLVGHWGWSVLYATSAILMIGGLLGVAGVPEPPVPGEHAARARIADVLLGPAGRTLLVSLLAASAYGAMFNLLAAAMAVPVAPFFMAYAAAALATRFGIGDLADRLGRRAVAGPALVVYAVAVAATSLVDARLGLILVGIGFGLSHGIQYPALAALALDQSPDEARGRAMSLFNLSFNVGVALGAIGFGALAKASGWPAAWAAAGLAPLLAIAVLWLPDRRK